MHRTRGAAVAAAFVGVALALAAAFVGFVLADIYQPHAPGAVAAELPEPVRRSDRWSDWHRTTSVLLLVAAAVSGALVAAGIVRGKRVAKRQVLAIAAATGAVVMSVVTIITGPLVEWDQLALRSVTVGSGVDGYWTAAFGDDVLVVLLDDAEVSQREYSAVLVTHLAAPVVGACSLLVLGMAVVGRAREDEVNGELESDASGGSLTPGRAS